MDFYKQSFIKKTDRISRIVERTFAKLPEIESDRARLLTESYRATENLPTIIRRAKAFEHILKNIPIVIREEELIVGSSTTKARGCQTFPEYSYEWLEAEFDTVAERSADPFYISEKTKARNVILAKEICLQQRAGYVLYGAGDASGNGAQRLHARELLL